MLLLNRLLYREMSVTMLLTLYVIVPVLCCMSLNFLV